DPRVAGGGVRRQVAVCGDRPLDVERRTGRAPRPLNTLDTLLALVTLRALQTARALLTLRSSLTLRAFRPALTGIALRALIALDLSPGRLRGPRTVPVHVDLPAGEIRGPLRDRRRQIAVRRDLADDLQTITLVALRPLRAAFALRPLLTSRTLRSALTLRPLRPARAGIPRHRQDMSDRTLHRADDRPGRVVDIRPGRGPARRATS